MTRTFLLCRSIWKIQEWAQRWRRSRHCRRLLVGCQAPFTEANVLMCLLRQTVNEIMALSLPITLRITQLSWSLSAQLYSVTENLISLSSALVKKKKKKKNKKHLSGNQMCSDSGSVSVLSWKSADPERHERHEIMLHLLAPGWVKCLNTTLMLSSKKKRRGKGTQSGSFGTYRTYVSSQPSLFRSHNNSCS